MSQPPRWVPARPASFGLRVIALLCFLIAAICAWPEGNFDHAAALIPLGLAAWVASTLILYP